MSDGCGFQLEKLPKGASCTDYKDVPARSDYWRDDTDSVTRCSNWNTGSGGDGGGDGDSSDGNDDSGFPSSVGAYERMSQEQINREVDPTWRPVVGWKYDGGRPRDYDGEIYVVVVDTGEDGDYSRYHYLIRGDDIRSRQSGRHDELEETAADAIEFMQDSEPRTDIPDLDVTVPNAIMRPLTATANRLGHGVKIEVTDADNRAGDFRVLRFEGGGGMAMYAVTIPSERVDGSLRDEGAISVSLDDIYRVCRDTKKANDIRLTVEDGRLHAKSGSHQGSDKYRHVMDYSGATPPFSGPADASVSTTGRNYRQAVRAIDVLEIRDSDGVAVVADGDEARLVAETDYGSGPAERIRAPLNLEDDEPYDVSGNAEIGVRYGALDDSSKSIPRPASTTVNMYLYDEDDGGYPRLVVEFVDEGTRFTHYLSATEDIADYDLSQPAKLLTPRCTKASDMEPICPSAAQTLSEPSRLGEGDEAPDWTATAHTGGSVSPEYDDSVVWFFPKAKGCRCSRQALQYDQLAEELDTTVYGVSSANPDELAEFVDSYDLNITMVSDPAGEVAERFGVGFDGKPERATFFVRNGEIVERIDGMAEISVTAPTEESGEVFSLAESDDVPEIVKTIEHPSVGVITGKRGSGKSSLAYHLGEEMHKRDGIIPVTVGLPPEKADALPDHWMNVESLDAAPHQSVVVVDEAYARFHAREAFKNVGMSELVNKSRHCSRTMLFVTQNSSHLDKNAVSEADVLYMKEPGAFHTKFERAGVRELTEVAERSFDQLPTNADKRRYTKVFTDDGEKLIETGEAEFYGEALSRSYSGQCTSEDTGKQNLSQPIPCLDDLDDGEPAFIFVHGDGSNLGRLNE